MAAAGGGQADTACRVAALAAGRNRGRAGRAQVPEAGYQVVSTAAQALPKHAVCQLVHLGRAAGAQAGDGDSETRRHRGAAAQGVIQACTLSQPQRQPVSKPTDMRIRPLDYVVSAGLCCRG